MLRLQLLAVPLTLAMLSACSRARPYCTITITSIVPSADGTIRISYSSRCSNRTDLRVQFERGSEVRQMGRSYSSRIWGDGTGFGILDVSAPREFVKMEPATRSLAVPNAFKVRQGAAYTMDAVSPKLVIFDLEGGKAPDGLFNRGYFEIR